MYKDEYVIAIIAAAGSGKRFRGELPKQFLKLGGQTVLQSSVRAFNENERVDSILVAAGDAYKELVAEQCAGFEKLRAVVSGGRERQDSIYNALMQARLLNESASENTLVLVHDAARPFVTQEIINSVTEGAWECGGAVPAVPLTDTVRQMSQTSEALDMAELLKEGGSRIPTRSLNRRHLCAVQTPQGFRIGILGAAYEKAYADGFFGTDDASTVERMGINLKIVKGDYANKKITTKEDMRSEMRIGSGYDVHRLAEGRELYLCGVKIPHEKGLLGHSDADVAVHALMDAMLGAAGLGDIGKHFPDSDERYKGISSLTLLREVCRMLKKEGYRVGNVDLTLIAQRPKIAPYIAQMKQRLAELLDVSANDVNIKGTTTEGLGFAGREEGIAAEAVCILYGI